MLALAAPVGLAQRGASTPSRSIDEIRADVESKLDLGNAYISDAAMIMAADYPGQYSINQISQIYSIMARGGWYYFSDPTGPESYQNANVSLQKGKIKNTIGMGDCDDYAILMTSLVQSIGGSARVIFAYDDDNQSGHAYSELYLGKNGTAEVDEIINWLKSEYDVVDLPGINYTGDEVWLNLDWGSDVTKAAYPGGPYSGEGSRNIRRSVIWQPLPDQMVPPLIVPIIDSMDSVEGRQTLNDSKGSTIKIDSIPGKKTNAVQLSYDLKDGGWIGISEEIDPYNLSSVAGLNFSYFLMEKQNTIEIRLVYDDGTAFGVSWSNLKMNSWQSLKALYTDLKCLNPGNKRDLEREFNTSQVRRMEFIVSNDPDAGDQAGQGIVILDEVCGLMAIPKGSPWEQAEEKKKENQARYLASESRLLGDDRPDSLQLSTLLAIESMKRYPSREADLSLRDGIKFLPIPHLRLNYSNRVNAMDFSSDGKYLATASDDGTARIWNVLSGHEFRCFPHGNNVQVLDFSPNSQYLATGCENGTICIWDINSKTKIFEINNIGKIDLIEFNSESRYVAALGHNYSTNDGISTLLKVLDIKRQEIFQFENVDAFHFSPNGNYLATVGGGKLNILDVATRIKRSINLEQPDALGLAFNESGDLLATVTSGYSTIWQVPELKKLCDLDHKNFEGTSSFYLPNRTFIEFHREGDEYLVTSGWRRIFVWDVASEEKYIDIIDEKRVSSNVVRPIKVFQKRGWIAIFNDDLINIYAIDIGHRTLVPKMQVMHRDKIIDMAISPDEKYMASTGNDNATQIWILDRDDEKKDYWISPSLEYLIKSSEKENNSKIFHEVWNLSAEKEQCNLVSNHSLDDISISLDGRYAASSIRSDKKQNAMKIQIWNLNKGDLVFNCSANNIQTLLINPNGDYCLYIEQNKKDQNIILNSNGDYMNPKGDIIIPPRKNTNMSNSNIFHFNLKLVDRKRSKELINFTYGGYAFENAIGIPCFSSDGRFLAVLDEIYAIEILNMSDINKSLSIKHNSPPVYFAFSPNGDYFISVFEDRSILKALVEVWDINARMKLIDKTITIDNNSANSIKDSDPYIKAIFSPDSRYLALVEQNNKTILIYNMKRDLEVHKIKSKLPLGLIRFSTDAVYLASSSDYQAISPEKISVQIWKVDGVREPVEIPSGGNVDDFYFTNDDKYLAILINTKQKLSNIFPERKLQIWRWEDKVETCNINDFPDSKLKGFSPNGKYIISENPDGSIESRNHIWPILPNDLINEACEHLNINLTRDEWNRYLPTEPYCLSCQERGSECIQGSYF